MDAIKVVEEGYRKDIPPFRVGDTVRVSTKVKEGDKERLQAFEGIVIARRGDGTRETFTVRKISYGVGVERIFPLYSPLINKIKVVSRKKIKRAKLYHLRDRQGKAAKIKESKTIRSE